MVKVHLPISKSIANRLLVLQAMHGDELMPVSYAMGEDVAVLWEALQRVHGAQCTMHHEVNVGNGGTAMRFLTAYCAQKDGCDVVLTGCERMKQRPIGALVDALRAMGADITYWGEEGFPPLHIRGTKLTLSPVTMPKSESSQFVSALLLIGVPVTTDDDSPYIALTRSLMARYPDVAAEADWSAAAFWYEYVALHGGEIEMPGLRSDSLQGDKKVAELFVSLGVETEFQSAGVVIRRMSKPLPEGLTVDFQSCPDLYPAVYFTCEKLGIPLHASGTDRLVYKESNRLEACALHQVRADHRIAMAMMAADEEVEDTECIGKSYPEFVSQLCSIRKW